MSSEKNDEKKLLERMKDLLLRGERMLGEACPRCGTPLFLIKATGLKYCPKCNVYLATPEELEHAKVDKKMLKVIDFEDYWRKKEVEPETHESPRYDEISEQAPQEETAKTERREEIKIRKPEKLKLIDTIDELIIALTEKIIIKLDRENIDVEKLFKWLLELLEVRKRVLNE
ncbi:MAG: autoantigen p27 domain-containing protein [Candidatus Njordarchaeales archaeon]